GVHNFDALQIYNVLKSMDEKLDLLRYEGELRATAQIFWNSLSGEKRKKLHALIQSTHLVLKTFPNSNRYQSVIDEIQTEFSNWETTLDQTQTDASNIA